VRLEEKSESKRQKTLERELEWIRMSPKARQSKGQARVSAYEKLLNQEAEARREELEIYIPPGPRLGDIVFEFKDVTKSYDDRLILDDFDATVPPGAIIGIVGPNGAGKTTLLKMIIGQEKPDNGSIRIGETVKLGYVDQSRTLDPEKTVYEEISQGAENLELGKRKINARGYVSTFNFAGSDQQKKVGILSGGERNRVHLAKTLTEGANVLLLDEPTNDLDVNTLRALEEALEEFAGTALVVSHDRWFLDRICTHLIVFEGDSTAKMYLGNWSDYETMMQEKFGKDLTPHRVKYRTLRR
jgi:sulfate-transporting ATPase